MTILSRKRLARFITLLLVAMWVQMMGLRSAFAFTTPQSVLELSSAGAGVGTTLTTASGQPIFDAAGRPMSVTGIRTDGANLTATAIADMLRVPVSDLFSYGAQVGASVPPVLSGTLTTITRSDGGVEQVFHMTAPDGSSLVFLADRTGANVYGIRVARVDVSGKASMFTAHGLNGNFTSPPWYLSPQAKAQYWSQVAQAQISVPVPPQVKPDVPGGEGRTGGSVGSPGQQIAGVSTRAGGGSSIPYGSAFVTGNSRVSLSTHGVEHRRVKW